MKILIAMEEHIKNVFERCVETHMYWLQVMAKFDSGTDRLIPIHENLESEAEARALLHETEESAAPGVELFVEASHDTTAKLLLTTAPEAYDGFGTRRLGLSTEDCAGRPAEIVAIPDRAFAWQFQRYASGLHARDAVTYDLLRDALGEHPNFTFSEVCCTYPHQPDDPEGEHSPEGWITGLPEEGHALG